LYAQSLIFFFSLSEDKIYSFIRDFNDFYNELEKNVNGIGILIGIFLAIIFIVLPIVKILSAPYINFMEKLVWFLISISGFPIAFMMDYSYSQAIKNAANEKEISDLISIHHQTSFSQVTFIFWALAVFLIFKIFYARKKAIWKSENEDKK
jgi:hypothetical protein